MANLQQAAWKWAKALCHGHTGSYKPAWGISLGAYDAAWDVVNAISEADRQCRDFGPEMTQAIVEQHLARYRKWAEKFRFELELQDSLGDPSQNEQRYEYIAARFRKPESKGSSPMRSFAERAMSSDRGIGSVPDEEQWWYLFPRELEGNYDALLAWTNEYYAQAIETLERMKAEVFA